MNRKLIYLIVFLVLALFVISACQEVGRRIGEDDDIISTKETPISGPPTCVSCAAPNPGCKYVNGSCTDCGELVCESESIIKEELSCTDSDSGKDYYMRGTVYGIRKNTLTNLTDYCVSSYGLQEMYCLDGVSFGNNIGEVYNFTCPNGCVDGACIPTNFSISDVTGLRDTYRIDEKISLLVKGLESDDTPTTPEEGFNVQAYVFDRERTKTYAGVNGIYNSSSGLWKAELNVPVDEKIYDLEIFLYCGKDDAICTTQYGKAAQQSVIYQFKVSNKVCSDSDGGKDYYMRGTVYGIRKNTLTNLTDYCVSSYGLQEMYCLDGVSFGNNIGEVYNFTCPNGCVDGACKEINGTTTKTNANFIFELQEGVDLTSDSGIPGLSSSNTIHIKSSTQDGIRLSNGKSINEMWITFNSTGDKGSLLTFYKDGQNSNKKIYYYDVNPKINDLELKIGYTNLLSILTLQDLRIATEDFEKEATLTFSFYRNNGILNSLGLIKSLEETDELQYCTFEQLSGNSASYGCINIGTTVEDYKTEYGTIVKNPKLNGANDRVELIIPLYFEEIAVETEETNKEEEITQSEPSQCVSCPADGQGCKYVLGPGEDSCKTCGALVCEYTERLENKTIGEEDEDKTDETKPSEGGFGDLTVRDIIGFFKELINFFRESF